MLNRYPASQLTAMINNYLTVDAARNEVEERLVQLAADYPQLCSRIPLESPSVQGRTYSAVRIGAGSSNFLKRGVLFCGGVHGNELGGAEVCINFAEELLRAYTAKSDLTFVVIGTPPKTFTAEQVTAVVTGLKIFVLPLVNPDGRVAGSRKNANRVDLSRNFDFLWDNPNTGGSTDISDPHHRGPAANSEPETTNLIALVDAFPIISRMVDIHTRTDGQLIAYHWAHDQFQTTNPNMNFTQAAANNWSIGQKSTVSGANNYEEYISPTDQHYVQRVAENMAEVINAIGGSWQKYPALPATQYANSFYGISGVATDYLFSRHISDPSKGKVYGWLIEYGPSRGAQELNPTFPQMGNIIQQINAGMMQLCLDSVFYWWKEGKLFRWWVSLVHAFRKRPWASIPIRRRTPAILPKRS
jgi:carboxypeptidase T